VIGHADRAKPLGDYCTGLPFPKVIDQQAPPLRPERHIPNSIATMRRRLVLTLVRNLPRCPCCAGRVLNREEALHAPHLLDLEFAQALRHPVANLDEFRYQFIGALDLVFTDV